MQDDDDTRPLTEAERISQTRFGARPIPKGHRRTNTADEDYRRIPPHGDVSPDGQRIWPQPSTATRLLVLGGTAAAAVAVTAGTALVLRRVTDALSGSNPTPRRKHAPERPSRHGFGDAGSENLGPKKRRHPDARRDDRYADDPERERAHRDTRHADERFGTDRPKDERFADEQFGDDRRESVTQDRRDFGRGASAHKEPRHPAYQDNEYRPRRRPRRRKPRNLIAEFEENSRRMTHSVDGVFGSLGTAMTGFLSVARQAGTIMREFGDAADLVRTVMDSARKPAPEQTEAMSGADKDRRTHKL